MMYTDLLRKRVNSGRYKIPYELGLLGHSDADVLLHSIMDAMLRSGGARRYWYTLPRYR